MTDPETGKPKMPGNKRCGTCFYYDPSPLWRKGWCRNPALFENHVNHLVEAGEYSCQGTFSAEFWLAAEKRRSGELPKAAPAQSSQDTSSGTADLAPEMEDDTDVVPVAEASSMAKSQAGPREIPRHTHWGPRPISRRGLYSIVIPVAFVAIALVSLFGWITYKTAGAKENNGISAADLEAPTPDLVHPMFSTEPTATPTVHAPALALDGYARVVGTDDNGLQVRLSAGSQSASVALLPEGTIVHLLKGPVEADGFLWWEVEAAGKSGWSAEEWLTAVAGPSG